MWAMALDRQAPIEASPLQWRELPDPVPGPGEVLLRVTCCAICRTDLHVIEGDLAPQTLPIVPGHQVIGTVEQLGPDCAILQAGQRVGVAWLRQTCGTCKYCTSGRENLCPAARFTGYHAQGGYATRMVVPEAFAYEIPLTFEDAQAAPLLCAGIIGYRALQRAAVPWGGSLAVYGFGSSAHVVLQIARHRGYRVLVVSRTPGHQALARELGAVWAGADGSAMAEQPDSAIIFAPAGGLVPQALAQLAPGGTLALAGIHMSAVPGLDYETHLFREKTVCSVTANTREDGRGLLAEAAAIPIRPHTTAFPLREANGALQALKADRINGSGVLTMDGAEGH